MTENEEITPSIDKPDEHWTLKNNAKDLPWLKKTKDQLDRTSTSFCLAKWNQVTIHLANGTTHSCHHCRVHKIPLEELKDNPSALHNTKEKKNTRKMMLNGERPSECNFCWRVEDLNEPGLYSDRVKKSSNKWNDQTINTIPQMPWDTNIAPKYVELDFSSSCNFKCIYCSPSYSTTWAKEIREHGPYNVGASVFNSTKAIAEDGGMPLEVDEDDNPYIQAFWKWLPDIIGNLRTLRVTGGEPLLSKNTFKLIDYLVEHPQPECQFDINSNLGAPKQYIDKLIEGIKRIHNAKAASNITIFTSCEAQGARAEYIRNGLNYKYWLSNLDRILTECPYIQISIMCTYNALSVTSFTGFLKDLLPLYHKHTVYGEMDGVYGRANWFPINLDMPYLRHPQFLSAWILTEDYLDYMDETIKFIEQNLAVFKVGEDGLRKMVKTGFAAYNAHDMRRVYGVMKNAIVNNIGRNNDVLVDRRGFHMFIDEHDRRRGASFLGTFPEMAEFYHFCKTECA